MAITDNTTGNLHLAGSAATLWDNTNKRVRLIQWVDNAGDIIDDSTLVLTINGTAITTKLQLAANISNYGVVVWQMGPFNPGFPVSSFVVTTMGTGELHVWID